MTALASSTVTTQESTAVHAPDQPVKTESFAGIAEACFDQIRQAASDVPAVLIRILDRIIDLAPSLNSAGLQAALAQQVTMIGHTSRQVMQSGKDLQDIERRCQRATRLLS